MTRSRSWCAYASTPTKGEMSELWKGTLRSLFFSFLLAFLFVLLNVGFISAHSRDFYAFFVSLVGASSPFHGISGTDLVFHTVAAQASHTFDNSRVSITGMFLSSFTDHPLQKSSGLASLDGPPRPGKVWIHRNFDTWKRGSRAATRRSRSRVAAAPLGDQYSAFKSPQDPSRDILRLTSTKIPKEEEAASTCTVGVEETSIGMFAEVPIRGRLRLRERRPDPHAPLQHRVHRWPIPRSLSGRILPARAASCVRQLLTSSTAALPALGCFDVYKVPTVTVSKYLLEHWFGIHDINARIAATQLIAVSLPPCLRR